MARDKCRIPGCDKEPDGKYCSTKHEVKYEHLEADAKDARRADEERHAVDKKDLPEYDGPPY